MPDTKPLPPAIERILGRAAQPSEDAGVEPDVRGAYDEVRAPRSRGREALMLEVRKADGASHALSYVYLTRIDFEPGDRIRLHFAEAVVQMGGKRLRSLYRRLLEHRVDAIQEGTEAEEELKPEEASHIDRIEIFNRMEDSDEQG